jgi:hypothetical protein
MNKIKTKYNVLAQSKLEKFVLSTAVIAVYYGTIMSSKFWT